MIIIENFKKEFFDKIIGKHLLIIVANGVDAVCSFKIIKHILKNYNVLFSYAIIKTKNELKEAYTNYGQIENILLINYGATIDIVEFFEISQDSNKIIYILDSQRPIHINNYYNQVQVKLLSCRERFDNVPDFDEIFKDDEEDEEESDEEDGERNVKRARLSKSYLDDKIRRREWKKRREDLLAMYEMFCYHGTSSALVAYNLADSVNQFTNELLWTAAVGHTSQYILNFINRAAYCEHLDFISSHLARVKLSRKYSKQKNKEEMFMEEKEELNLWLYRHWSLNDALHITPLTLSTFKLCRLRGLTRLNEFLAYLGIPQETCKDPFPFMKHDIKSSVFSLFKEHSERFNLSKEELFLPSYVATCGYRIELSAIDAVFVLAAILEDKNVKEDYSDKFNRAINMMSMWDNKLIENGVNLAINFLKAIHKQTLDLMESNAVLAYGSFLHVELRKSAPSVLQSPLIQNIFARYLLSASFSIRPKLGAGKKADRSPMILCSNADGESLILFGIPPLASDQGKNLFGRVFETVLTNLNYQVEQDSLDVCKIKINQVDKMKVFDRISRLLMS